MAVEEIIGNIFGTVGSIIPILQIIALLGIVAGGLYLLWKRNPFKRFPTIVLIKHRRGTDFSPEMTYGRRTKNAAKQQIYKLRNGDEIPAQFFKDLRPMGRKSFVEVWQTEDGKYDPAPSPFETANSNPPNFSEADVNWLIQQHQNNIRMFERKSLLMQYLPLIIPMITIVIVVFALILFQMNVVQPTLGATQGIAAINSQVADKWMNITAKYTLCPLGA